MGLTTPLILRQSGQRTHSGCSEKARGDALNCCDYRYVCTELQCLVTILGLKRIKKATYKNFSSLHTNQSGFMGSG